MSVLVRGQDPNGNLVSLSVDANGNLKILDTANPPATVLNGATSVTTAGTRVQLATPTACKSVTLVMNSANTKNIYVGGAGVSAANGVPRAAGDTVSLNISDLSAVWLDADVNGEGVTYLGVV